MLSETIGNILDSLHSVAEDMAGTMSDGLFLASAACLQEEMVRIFGGQSEM